MSMDAFLKFLAMAAVVGGGVAFVALLLLIVGLKTGRIVITYED